jgi:hypothetical protein
MLAAVANQDNAGAYQARLGKPFLHDDYLSELTSLRGQLKAGLSAMSQMQGDEGKRPAQE